MFRGDLRDTTFVVVGRPKKKQAQGEVKAKLGETFLICMNGELDFDPF